ncbi:MAG: methyltransferase [Hornefia sp.]|nr:methyltransferase [Hornefia sp.]
MTRRIDDTGFGGIRIIQDEELFCYGMDAVILADFAAERIRQRRKNFYKVCDFCTGNGIVPLILSHKVRDAEILGVEVQKRCFELAKENIAFNKLEDRISVLNENIKAFCTAEFKNESRLANSFDGITMNPPYTKAGCGIQCDNRHKNIARHELLGTLDDFMKGSSVFLKDKGDLFMIHRPHRLADVILTGKKYSFSLKELQLISGKNGQKPNLAVMHFVKNGSPELKILPQIFLRNADGNFSKNALKLYE